MPPQIVLVEDNPGDALLVQLALEAKAIDFRLTRFYTGKEATRVLCESPWFAKSTPDAILLDLNTPQSDGFETLIALRNSPHLRNVPIAILTSSRARSDKQRAALQCTRYIEKPSDLEGFIERVGTAVKEMLDLKPKSPSQN